MSVHPLPRRRVNVQRRIEPFEPRVYSPAEFQAAQDRKAWRAAMLAERREQRIRAMRLFEARQELLYRNRKRRVWLLLAAAIAGLVWWAL